jgi:hypothetical protein
MDDSGNLRSLLTFALTGLLIVGSARSAQAQLAPLPPGSRLRVTAPTLALNERVGVFQGARDTILVLQTTAATLTVPISSIMRLELSSGRKLSKIGGVAGLLVGAGAGGFALGCLANRDDYGVLCGGQNDTKFVVGAVVGGLAGAALGAVLFRSERWKRIDVAIFR